MQNSPNTLLIAVASAIEWRALWPHEPGALWEVCPVHASIDAVLTGVGKANAAGGTVAAFDPHRHCGFISLGLGGSLPDSGLVPGDALVASISVFADEGLATPIGYQTCAEMGFAQVGDDDTVLGHAPWIQHFNDRGCDKGVIATVSTCSGTDALAQDIVRRTGARAEAMEGASVGLAAFRLGVPFAEVRVISNTTGNRERQEWRRSAALDRLGAIWESITSIPIASDRT